MKRHGNLFDQIASFDNLLAAAKAAYRGKRFRDALAKTYGEHLSQTHFVAERRLTVAPSFKTGEIFGRRTTTRWNHVAERRLTRLSRSSHVAPPRGIPGVACVANPRDKSRGYDRPWLRHEFTCQNYSLRSVVATRRGMQTRHRCPCVETHGSPRSVATPRSPSDIGPRTVPPPSQLPASESPR